MLRKQMIESWRNAGYCLVDNLFKPEEVRKLSSELEATLFSQNTNIKGQVCMHINIPATSLKSFQMEVTGLVTIQSNPKLLPDAIFRIGRLCSLEI